MAVRPFSEGEGGPVVTHEGADIKASHSLDHSSVSPVSGSSTSGDQFISSPISSTNTQCGSPGNLQSSFVRDLQRIFCKPPTNLQDVFIRIQQHSCPSASLFGRPSVSRPLLVQKQRHESRAATLLTRQDHRLWDLRQSQGCVESLRAENGEPLPLFLHTCLHYA